MKDDKIEAFRPKLWGKWIVDLLERKDKEWKYIKSLEDNQKKEMDKGE